MSFDTLLSIYNSPLDQLPGLRVALEAEKLNVRPTMILASLLFDINNLTLKNYLPLGKEVLDLLKGACEARRYLVSTDYQYRNKLTPTARVKFEQEEGGLMNSLEINEFKNLALVNDYILLCRIREYATNQVALTKCFEDYRSLFQTLHSL